MTDRSHYEGWTHEVWLRCRFEETARWQRQGDENDPTLARVDSGEPVQYCFPDLDANQREFIKSGFMPGEYEIFCAPFD